MIKPFSGQLILAMATAFLLMSGCKGSVVTKPEPKPAAAAVPERVVHVRSRSVRKQKTHAIDAQSSQPEKTAIGTQEGGSRQGVTLNLKYVVSTFAGKAGVIGAKDGIGRRASFDAPRGITSDGINLYVADLNNHTIRKIDIASGQVTTIAGLAGKKGSSDGRGSAARFNRPYGITTDGENIYVTDSNNHSIRQIDMDSGEVTTIAGVAGVVGYSDGVGEQAKFFIPEGITTDGSSLFVADTHNHSIRQIDLDSMEVKTIAGQSGAPGFLDDIGTKARFSFPKGIATDGHNLYVVDFGNQRVRKMSFATGMVSTLAGSDKIETTSDVQIESPYFNYPTGVTTDGRYLYVVDTFNRTIRKIALSNGTVTTIAGKAELEGAKDGTGTEARFKDPVGITTDGNALFITDSSNQTIRKIR